jgi:hypothetical protein
MSLYKVIEKSTGREVYRYEASEPIAWVGMEFDACDHLLVPDATETPAAPRQWYITPQSFLARFTQQEQARIELASTDDPAAPITVRYMAAALRANQRRVLASRFIDLDLADTRNGVLQLAGAGLLDAEGRADAILYTEPTAAERYIGLETGGV